MRTLTGILLAVLIAFGGLLSCSSPMYGTVESAIRRSDKVPADLFGESGACTRDVKWSYVRVLSIGPQKKAVLYGKYWEVTVSVKGVCSFGAGLLADHLDPNIPFEGTTHYWIYKDTEGKWQADDSEPFLTAF